MARILSGGSLLASDSQECRNRALARRDVCRADGDGPRHRRSSWRRCWCPLWLGGIRGIQENGAVRRCNGGPRAGTERLGSRHRRADPAGAYKADAVPRLRRAASRCLTAHRRCRSPPMDAALHRLHRPQQPSAGLKNACHSGAARRAEPGTHEHRPLENGFRARSLASPRNDKSVYAKPPGSLRMRILSMTGDAPHPGQKRKTTNSLLTPCCCTRKLPARDNNSL